MSKVLYACMRELPQQILFDVIWRYKNTRVRKPTSEYHRMVGKFKKTFFGQNFKSFSGERI